MLQWRKSLVSRNLSYSFLERFVFLMSISLPYGFAGNTVVMSGLVLLTATWICYISCRNGYAGGLLLLHWLPLYLYLPEGSNCPNFMKTRYNPFPPSFQILSDPSFLFLLPYSFCWMCDHATSNVSFCLILWT